LPTFLASVRDLCLFRRGPEDMPYSPVLLVALLVAYGLLEAGFNLHEGTPAALVADSLVGDLAIVGTLFLLLRGRDRAERFVQTMTALAAVDLLFDAASVLLMLPLPLQAWRRQWLAGPVHIVPTGNQALLVLAIVVLCIWQLCVCINILRRALELSVAGCVLILLLLGCVNLVVVTLGAGVLGVT
jgi:hypothetical protein